MPRPSHRRVCWEIVEKKRSCCEEVFTSHSFLGEKWDSISFGLKSRDGRATWTIVFSIRAILTATYVNIEPQSSIRKRKKNFFIVSTALALLFDV
jgi:hypothetical protein